jgi:Rrp7 RRM-like N-terminal domain
LTFVTFSNRKLLKNILMAAVRPSKRQKKSSSSSSGTLEWIENFALLPISLPKTSSNVPSASHFLFLKKDDQPQDLESPTTEPSHTIFVVNVPIDSTVETLRGLFASLGGRPEEVRFRGQNMDPEEGENISLPDVWGKRLHRTGSAAHVTFSTAEEVDKVFKTISSERRKTDGPIREWGVGVDKAHASLGPQRNPPYGL